jgi:hypothetical protein
MSEIPNLPEPREAQEIREIIEKHKERTSNLAPIIKMGEVLKEHFDSFVTKEIDGLKRQLQIVSPWFPVTDEITELQTLEKEYELVRDGLELLLTTAKKGNISSLEQLDLSVIGRVFGVIDNTEKLWDKVQKWSLVLLNLAGLFQKWSVETHPKGILGRIRS